MTSIREIKMHVKSICSTYGTTSMQCVTSSISFCRRHEAKGPLCLPLRGKCPYNDTLGTRVKACVSCVAATRSPTPCRAARPLRLRVAHATPVNVLRDWDHDGLAQVHHRVGVLERAIACQDRTACAAVRHGLQHVDAEERQPMRAKRPKRMLACHGFQLVEHLMNI